MSSLNKVILIGRLTRDPELRYTPSGKPVTNFTLAVDRNRGGQGQERETDFIDCSVWQQAAEFASKYGSKGRLVCVEGRLQVRTWDDKDTGQKRKAFEVVCSDFRLLDRKDGGGASGGAFEARGQDEPVRETVYSGAAAEPRSDNSFEDDIPF